MKLKWFTLSGLFAGLVMIFLFSSQQAAAQKISYTDSWGAQGMTLMQQSPNSVTLNFSVKEFTFSNRVINGETMKEIEFPGNLLQNDEGAPNLPSISRYIAIPHGATAHIEITDARAVTFQNIEMAPAPRIPLDTDRGPLQYNKNISIYSKNAMYPAEPVILSQPSKMRGVDVVLMNVTPYQYNPVTKELIVYRDLEVNVTFTGGTGEFGETKYRNRFWDPILHDNILNAASLPQINYSQQAAARANTEETGFEYLIIVPNDPVFKQWADSIKAFRTEQGILTGIVTLQQIGGNTTTQIETYINNAYNTWDIPPTAILLMADYGTNAQNSITSPIWDNYCVSDNIYADVDNDDMPEIVLARMTANDAAQLKIMVEKFLGYERTPPTNANFYHYPITALGWQTERWFQICSEVVGGFWKYGQGKEPIRVNAVYDGNPTVDPWSTATNTSTVVSYFGPAGLGYIPATPQELGGWDGGTATQVNNALNNGAFMLQHRDHGMETGWGEPSYTNSSINSLMNVGKLSYILSVNCLTGKYNWNNECFAEKFHRYTYNNQYAGAVGILAASETSYSFVNDTYVWGLYDNLWPDFMPGYGAMYEERGVLPAFGNCAGKYFLQQSSWPYNTGNKEVTYNLFHHHGDAFLTVFSEVPQNLAVNHASIMISSATSFDVTATAGSFIALTYNGQILGTAAGTGLPVAVPVSGIVPIGATVKVVVTKQNYYRHYSDFIVISPDGPYVITDSYTVNDATGNNNQHIDSGEEVYLSLAEHNLGNSASLNTQVTINLADPYISFLDNTEAYDTVPAQQIKTITDGFRVKVLDNVPNNHAVLATVTATNGTDAWTSYIMLECWAPALSVGNMIIDDATGGNGNGRLDAGETADVKIYTTNTGLSAAIDAIGDLSLTSGFLTLNNVTYNVGNINPLAAGVAIFNVTVNPSAPAGLPVDLIYHIVAGEYSGNKTFSLQVGLIVEDWETGDFTKFPWTSGGNQSWTITNTGTYEGDYSAVSGTISNSQSSQLIIQYNVPNPDTLRFTCKVSSEANKDYLKFYMDNVMKGSWSGNVNWTTVKQPLTAGLHTFKWVYSKDGTGASGSDCAWLDFIVFPAPLITTAYAGADDYACTTSPYQCAGNAANYTTVAWTTSGTGTFNDATLLDPVYTPSSNDIAAGSVTLTLSVNGVSGTSTDDMVLHIIQPATASAGSGLAACQSVGVLLNEATAGNYASISWSTSGTGSFDDIHAVQPTYIASAEDAAAGSVTLTMAVANQACEPVESSLQLTVHPVPAPAVTGLNTVCEETANVIYSTPMVNGNSYQWTVEGGTIISGAGTNQVTVNWGAEGQGTISLLEQTAFDCEALSITPVTIHALPEPAISGELNLCVGNSQAYVTPSQPGHSYSWQVNGGTFTTGQNTNEATILWGTAGIFTLQLTETIDATQCAKTSTTTVAVIDLSAKPAAPQGAAEVDLYKNGTTDYSAIQVEDMTYSWQLLPAEAGIIAGNGANAIVTWNDSYRGDATVAVKVANSCGESAWSDATTTKVFSSLGVEVNAAGTAISITPNPNNGVFRLKIRTAEAGTISYTITNASGARAFEKRDLQTTGAYTEELHLGLASGTYTLTVITAKGSYSGKFVVKE